VRVRRDDLVTFQVDGTHGSAVAGLTDCRTQARVNTPKPVWNPDVRQTLDFYEGWELVPDTQGLAALVAGYFAGHAGLPPPATAPRVREFQLRQAEVALPWAARELGLPQP